MRRLTSAATPCQRDALSYLAVPGLPDGGAAGVFALRKTRLWLPWLTLASYFFYGWWNPYYLLLVMYSTLLDFGLVALMDHCPRHGEKVDVIGRLTRLRFDDRVLKVAFLGSVLAGWEFWSWRWSARTP